MPTQPVALKTPAGSFRERGCLQAGFLELRPYVRHGPTKVFDTLIERQLLEFMLG